MPQLRNGCGSIADTRQVNIANQLQEEKDIAQVAHAGYQMVKGYPRTKMRPDRLPVIHPAPVQAQKVTAFHQRMPDQCSSDCPVLRLCTECQNICNHVAIAERADIVIIRAVGN
ncbi:TPA: hypothetical protein QCI19_003495 [Enterobacter ludwigii]|nr:hypothetical protein [Enterobacter ludwigii]